jgi:signal transduction histidine kinase
MIAYNFSILFFSFCSLLLGVVVWLKRQDAVGKRFLYLSLTYSGWAFFISINLNNNMLPEVGLLGGRIGNGFALFIPPFWYHFLTVFIGADARRYPLIKIFYITAFLTSCFVFTPLFISEVRPMVGFLHYPKAGPIYGFYVFFFFSVISLGFIDLLRKIRRTEGVIRRQMQGLFWTTLAGYAGGCPTFLPVYGIAIPQYGLLLLPFYPFALTYVMIKEGLFDVEGFAQAAHRDKLTAIGVLATSINHEVRNPLYIIRELSWSWIDRKKEKSFKDDREIIEKAEEIMRKSMEQSDRAMDIIRRFSAFAKSKIDGEIKFTGIRLRVLIEDILPLICHELTANQIALIRDIPSEFPEVRADRRYLEEIFFNLLVNAAQAIKSGASQGKITVSARCKSDTNMADIIIQDSGPGIPEKDLSYVFRPFHSTKEEGTGLGLFITKQLVEKIHGRIKVFSEVGRGTKFILTLPLMSQ